MVARLDKETNTAHIGTTRGEMTLRFGRAPRERELMLQDVLEWLIEKNLLAALPATPPLQNTHRAVDGQPPENG